MKGKTKIQIKNHFQCGKKYEDRTVRGNYKRKSNRRMIYSSMDNIQACVLWLLWTESGINQKRWVLLCSELSLFKDWAHSHSSWEIYTCAHAIYFTLTDWAEIWNRSGHGLRCWQELCMFVYPSVDFGEKESGLKRKGSKQWERFRGRRRKKEQIIEQNQTADDKDLSTKK